jgi:hypothetical protein
MARHTRIRLTLSLLEGRETPAGGFDAAMLSGSFDPFTAVNDDRATPEFIRETPERTRITREVSKLQAEPSQKLFPLAAPRDFTIPEVLAGGRRGKWFEATITERASPMIVVCDGSIAVATARPAIVAAADDGPLDTDRTVASAATDSAEQLLTVSAESARRQQYEQALSGA